MKKLSKEIWRKIEEAPGYEISNYGRVMSYKKAHPALIKGCVDKDGYRMVILYNTDAGNGKYIVRKNHRLVAQYFLKKARNKKATYINHVDGDINNNHFTNLRWVTPSENILHAFRTGAIVAPKGERAHKAKLSNYEVQLIRTMWTTGAYKVKDLAKNFDCSSTHISQIVAYKARVAA